MCSLEEVAMDTGACHDKAEKTPKDNARLMMSQRMDVGSGCFDHDDSVSTSFTSLAWALF